MSSAYGESDELYQERERQQQERRKHLFAPISTPSLAATVHGHSMAIAGGLAYEKWNDQWWGRSSTRANSLGNGGFHMRQLPNGDHTNGRDR